MCATFDSGVAVAVILRDHDNSRMLAFRGEHECCGINTPDGFEIFIPLMVERRQHFLNVGVRYDSRLIADSDLRHGYLLSVRSKRTDAPISLEMLFISALKTFREYAVKKS